MLWIWALFMELAGNSCLQTLWVVNSHKLQNKQIRRKSCEVLTVFMAPPPDLLQQLLILLVLGAQAWMQCSWMASQGQRWWKLLAYCWGSNVRGEKLWAPGGPDSLAGCILQSACNQKPSLPVLRLFCLHEWQSCLPSDLLLPRTGI